MNNEVREAGSLRTFFDHLDELRGRLLRSAGVFIVALFIFYAFSDRVLKWVIIPAGKLYFTAPSDAFMAQMILTVFGGLFLSLPYILFEIWQFVGLALKEEEKKNIFYFLPLSIGLFALGVVFAYFAIIPLIYQFFLSFSSDILQPMITVKNYISFIGNMTLAFGVVFQLPLILIFLAKIGIATPEFLIQKRRHAIVLILVVSAVVTPPDIVSMMLMTIPLMILYEIGVMAVKFQYARQKKEGPHAAAV